MLIKEYRKLNNLSVVQMANILGLSRQHIYDIEKGDAFPSRNLALRIEEATKGAVTTKELLFPDA